MNKQQINVIATALLKIKGKKLQTFMRSGSMGDFGFGEIIDREIRKFDEDKKIVKQTVKSPQFAFHADCHFRLSCGDEILLARGDVFQPSNKLLQDPHFDYNLFDWDVHENNRFDEIAQKYFSNNTNEFIVKKITVSSFGDIRFYFENHFILDIMPDISGNEECWRFFEFGSDEHLIVSGQGILTADEEAENIVEANSDH